MVQSSVPLLYAYTHTHAHTHAHTHDTTHTQYTLHTHYTQTQQEYRVLVKVDARALTVDAQASTVDIRASTIDQWYKALYHCYMKKPNQNSFVEQFLFCLYLTKKDEHLGFCFVLYFVFYYNNCWADLLLYMVISVDRYAL